MLNIPSESTSAPRGLFTPPSKPPQKRSAWIRPSLKGEVLPVNERRNLDHKVGNHHLLTTKGQERGQEK